MSVPRREREAVLDGELVRRYAARGLAGDAYESGDRSGGGWLLQRGRHRVLQLPGLGRFRPLLGSDAQPGRFTSPSDVLGRPVAHILLSLPSSSPSSSTSSTSPATAAAAASSPRWVAARLADAKNSATIPRCRRARKVDEDDPRGEISSGRRSILESRIKQCN